MKTVRGSVLSGLLLAVALGAGAGWGPAALSQERGGGPARAGDPDAELLARYQALAVESDDPVDWYNYGTALLRSALWEQASETLLRAAEAEDEFVDTFARYNQGLASAESGRGNPGESEEGREQLIGARDAFREVLRRAPVDEDARWNLELIERWLRPPGGGGGGGGGGRRWGIGRRRRRPREARAGRSPGSGCGKELVGLPTSLEEEPPRHPKQGDHLVQNTITPHSDPKVLNSAGVSEGPRYTSIAMICSIDMSISISSDTELPIRIPSRKKRSGHEP